MLKPVCLNCGHSGCRECLTELTAQNAMPKCPMCRKHFRAASMSVNVALDHVTSELPVECLSDGCGWKGTYGKCPDHFHTCPKLRIKCENTGCLHEAVREEMLSHAASCNKRKVPCPDCTQSVTWELFKDHQGKCSNAVVQCPLGCGKPFHRYGHTSWMISFSLRHPVDLRGIIRKYAGEYACEEALWCGLAGSTHQWRLPTRVLPEKRCGHFWLNSPRISEVIQTYIMFFRSDLNLHLHKCGNKACECEVTGCRRIVMRKDMTQHLQEAALSHFRLRSGEIQRLRQQIHEKVKS